MYISQVMIILVNFEGVKATVQNFKLTAFSIAFLAVFAIFLSACGGNSGGPANNGPAASDPNEIAARVNGKEIHTGRG